MLQGTGAEWFPVTKIQELYCDTREWSRVVPCYKDTRVIICYERLEQGCALLQGYNSYTVLQGTGSG